MTSRTSALSRSLRSLSCWNQYVIPSWRETIWSTSSSKKEKVRVCCHIQLGTMPSKPCSLALKIITTNKNITLPEIFLRAQPWGRVWWVHRDPLPTPTFPYGLNEPLTKTLINNVIIDSNNAHNMSLSSYYLQGSFKLQDFFQTFFQTLQEFSQTSFQNNTSFPDSRLSNRWSMETLKNVGAKLCSRCAANKWARLNKIWPKRKIFHLQRTCCSFEKKIQTFYHFFQTFCGSGKLLQANFKTFSRIQDSVQTLYLLLYWFIMNYKLVRPFSILTLCIKTSDLSKALFMSSYAGSVIGLKKEVRTLDFTNTQYGKRRHSHKDNIL